MPKKKIKVEHEIEYDGNRCNVWDEEMHMYKVRCNYVDESSTGGSLYCGLFQVDFGTHRIDEVKRCKKCLKATGDEP